MRKDSRPANQTPVFQVLKSIAYGDRDFLESKPHLLRAMVFVHLASHIQVQLSMFGHTCILGSQQLVQASL